MAYHKKTHCSLKTDSLYRTSMSVIAYPLFLFPSLDVVEVDERWKDKGPHSLSAIASYPKTGKKRMTIIETAQISHAILLVNEC